MLKINNLSITTNKGRCLLKDFSFVLNENDKIALIGEEGNGKSTLLKIIAQQDVSDYVSYHGEIETRDTLGYIPQSIPFSYYHDTIEEFITNNEEYPDYNKFYQVIKEVNLSQSLIEENRAINTLSGGEKVKVSLARVLYQEPDILLFDEPTNDLDIETLIWLEEFIKKENRPLIFISHDETLLENCSNGIIHLEQLKRKTESKFTIEHIGYQEYAEKRLHLLERNHQIAFKEKQEFNKQLEKYRRIYQKVEYQQSHISRQDPHGGRLLKKKMHAIKALGKNLEEKKENLTPKIEPEEAIDIFFESISLNPNKVILDFHLDKLQVQEKILSQNIHLTILGKDKICIIGKNGIGKTTLFRKIYQSLKEREDIHMGYIPQNYYEVMNYELTPVEYLLENVEYCLKPKVQSYLGALKFTTEEMTHKISECSEGQKCKILIVKQIIDGCDVLLLDEPTRNLSPLSNPKIREILVDYKGCIIAVSHDRKFIQEVTETIYELNEETLKKIG